MEMGIPGSPGRNVAQGEIAVSFHDQDLTGQGQFAGKFRIDLQHDGSSLVKPAAVSGQVRNMRRLAPKAGPASAQPGNLWIFCTLPICPSKKKKKIAFSNRF